MNAQDVARFSKAVLALQDCRSLTELGPALLRSMEAICSADIHVVNTIRDDKLKVKIAGDSSPPENMEVFNAHIQDHPLLGLIVRKGGQAMWAARWSDYLTLRTFRQTGLYHDFFRPLGTHRQLAITIDVNGENTLGLSFCRGGKDFRPEDARLLELLLPHMQHTVQDLISRADLDQALALRDAAIGDEAVMVVDEARGAIVFATERARRIMREHFVIHAVDELPAEILAWLRSSPAPGKTRTWHRPGRRVSLSCGSRVHLQMPEDEIIPVRNRPPPLRCLRFSEASEARSLVLFQSLGLTPREAEVLHWMTEGKRNAEIAVIVGSSLRTVEKHVANLMNKLRVETRTAAVAMALAEAGRR